MKKKMMMMILYLRISPNKSYDNFDDALIQAILFSEVVVEEEFNLVLINLLFTYLYKVVLLQRINE